jgi:tetratricopeptide (TPR) repeat protein
MKKIKIYIAALSTALLLGACNKQLNISPSNQIDANKAILTAADVQSTLIGAYNRMSLTDLYGGSVFMEPDLMAFQSNAKWGGTFQGLTQIASQQIDNNNTFINSMWLAAYRVINQTNNVLANLDKVVPANKNSTEGQAKFLRGLVYFEMVRLFGKSWNDGDPNVNLGVPLVLTPTTVVTESSSYPARATVSQVYQQAINDLTDAEAKLDKDATTFFANSYAASAILARIYLQQGKYDLAITAATKVISAGAYSLVPVYKNEFRYPILSAAHFDNTSEDIFAIQLTSQLGTGISNTLNTYYASADFGGRGDIVVRPAFLTLFDADDARLAIYNEDSDGVLRCDKFDNLYGNIHVIRLAELYLIRAEANLRLGTATDADPIDDINVIRQRAGVPDLAAVAVDDVLKERVLELAFEGGFFFHDAKRLGLPLGTLPYNSAKVVFPIPQLEIIANKNLKQNEGY